MAAIGCVVNVNQVEVDFEIVNILITNDELSVIDVGPANESSTVPLLACSARVLTIVMFGRVIRLLITRFHFYRYKLELPLPTLIPAGRKVFPKAALKRIPSW